MSKDYKDGQETAKEDIERFGIGFAQEVAEAAKEYICGEYDNGYIDYVSSVTE
jgi:S-adenosylmethionine synthetase